MKRLYLPLLIAICLLLSGCKSSSALERFESFRAETAQKETLSFTARIRAEYDDKSLSFLLDCCRDAEGCSVSIIEPELLRGISARAAAGESELIYEGVRLDTGPLDAFGLCPMSALPLLLEAVALGYVDTVWEEDGQIAALIVPSDTLQVELRLDKFTLEPVHAELISEGRVRVFADIENWG